MSKTTSKPSPGRVEQLDHQTLGTANVATFHRNPRRGDVDAIAESLQRTGQYRPIVVNQGTHTSRPLEVLAGNHTLMAARKLEWPTIEAVIVDVDDETAERIVLADNRTADLGDYNDQTLVDLLQNQPDLTGTGYDDQALADLLDGLNDETPDFDPEENDDVRLDRQNVTDCPKCGHTFVPETRSVDA